jgi:hypothetical protein
LHIRGWDQFETNEMLFGVKSTFDEELYTTKLERGPRMKELEREAVRIAREIEGEETSNLHLAEVRLSLMSFSASILVYFFCTFFLLLLQLHPTGKRHQSS